MDKKIEMNKFHEIELEKSFDLIQTIQSLRIQVSIFFATVNLGALSLGVSQKRAIFFLFAALLFGVMLVVDLTIRSFLAHAYYRVLHIHSLYAKGDNTFLPYTTSRLAREVRGILKIRNETERIKVLKSLPMKVKNLIGFWFPVIASLIEIGVGLYLWLGVSWQLI